MQSPDIEATAELLLRFTDRVRRAAARYMVPGRHSKDPLHLAYIKRLCRLSEEDRSDLVRVINQMLNSLPAL